MDFIYSVDGFDVKWKEMMEILFRQQHQHRHHQQQQQQLGRLNVIHLSTRVGLIELGCVLLHGILLLLLELFISFYGNLNSMANMCMKSDSVTIFYRDWQQKRGNLIYPQSTGILVCVEISGFLWKF